MLRCPNCQSGQIDGTVFCTVCGASLAAPVRRQSTTLFKKGLRPEATEPVAMADAAPPVAPSEARLALYVLPSGRQMRLKLQEELLIGRRDSGRGITPDVDLSDDGGFNAGVSRRHAIISWDEGDLFVEDLGSPNGTFVNEQRIKPQQRAPLRNGDTLRCGMLTLRVELSP
ncbi:MAG: FHA domain-containing protein [Roseiflexaceae bacterium]|nr:FHA domain-containing protein [Roseiflexaceae bacterium]